MNSDTRELIEEVLRDAGAICECPQCIGEELDTEDADALGVAIAMATTAWKSGERGFRSMSREEVVHQVTAVLQSFPSRCTRQ